MFVATLEMFDNTKLPLHCSVCRVIIEIGERFVLIEHNERGNFKPWCPNCVNEYHKISGGE